MLFTLLASAALAASHAGTNETVDVDGSRYRVRVKDSGEVIVFTKHPFRGRTIVERDRMRRAVKVATGCALIDDFYRDNRLVGALACPD